MSSAPSPQPVPSPPVQDALPVPSADDCNMGMLIHLGGVLTGFIMPLIIWLIKKDQSRFVDDQGKEALNFHINLAVHALILVLLTVVTCGFGAVLFIPWVVYIMVIQIIACVNASKGVWYRYPLTVRVLQ